MIVTHTGDEVERMGKKGGREVNKMSSYCSTVDHLGIECEPTSGNVSQDGPSFW